MRSDLAHFVFKIMGSLNSEKVIPFSRNSLL